MYEFGFFFKKNEAQKYLEKKRVGLDQVQWPQMKNSGLWKKKKKYKVD